jgi:DNA mismatch repair protein MutH
MYSYTKEMQKLTVNQVVGKLKVTDFTSFDKPGKNKGSRGQLLENALGIVNGSSLKDMIDGELKSFTQGETIAVTQLKHCLSEIIEDSISFNESKVGQKLKQTVYVGFTRKNNYIGTTVMNEESDPKHYQQLREDYEYICDKIRYSFDVETELNTITGPNNLLQIRTKASKTKKGYYVPLKFAGVTLKDKGMAFYLCSHFGKIIV